MSIIKTISKYEFIDSFRNSETYKNNFTYEALQALYDYLEEYCDSTGENIELDIVSICCEYSEYETAWEAMEQYQPDDMPIVDIADDENPDLVEINIKSEQLALDWLNDRMTVITFDGGIIINNF